MNWATYHADVELRVDSNSAKLDAVDTVHHVSTNEVQNVKFRENIDRLRLAFFNVESTTPNA